MSPWLGSESFFAFCTKGDADSNNAEEAGVEKTLAPTADEVQIVYSFYSQGHRENNDDTTDYRKHYEAEDIFLNSSDKGNE